MILRRIAIGFAGISLVSFGLAALPVTSAQAQSCPFPEGCTFRIFTGFGPTQAAAQAAVDQIVAQNGCDLYGTDHFFMFGSGWGDQHDGICPSPPT